MSHIKQILEDWAKIKGKKPFISENKLVLCPECQLQKLFISDRQRVKDTCIWFWWFRKKA